jgi:hypothetical protein
LLVTEQALELAGKSGDEGVDGLVPTVEAALVLVAARILEVMLVIGLRRGG